MAIKTSWLSPPHTIRGLDHIGTQGPCILIYSQLLPGITNVVNFHAKLTRRGLVGHFWVEINRDTLRFPLTTICVRLAD